MGHVYATGVAYMTDDVVDDPFFYPTLDLTDGFQTKSVLCVPIRIESSVCGVLELVNRNGPRLQQLLRDHLGNKLVIVMESMAA